jgi:hypothetical protein
MRDDEIWEGRNKQINNPTTLHKEMYRNRVRKVKAYIKRNA